MLLWDCDSQPCWSDLYHHETLEEVTTEHLFIESYDSVLRELGDRFAPERSMRLRRQNIAV